MPLPLRNLRSVEDSTGSKDPVKEETSVGKMLLNGEYLEAYRDVVTVVVVGS